MKLIDQIPPGVLDITPYQAGKTAAQMQRPGGAKPLKLSSNENPLGTGRLALEQLADPAGCELNRYPDAGAVELRDAIGGHLGIDPALITCGNGSNEILEMAATLMLRPGRKSVYSEHAFIVYHLATLARGAERVVVPAKAFGHDLEGLAEASRQDDVGIVFIANPNNPTGTWHPPEAILEFLRKVPPHVIAVLDEAYLEYAEDGRGASLDWLGQFPNLIISRTFSKMHGLAGLRIGYGIANPELTGLLNRIRQPFNANSAAQRAAAASLGDDEFIEASKRNNVEGMLQLQRGLAKLGYPTIPSQGNFICLSTRGSSASFEALADAGIIVRQIDEYGLAGWLRATVGTPADNERLLAALPPLSS